ncbi:proenkephalin-B [Denticeps clupeoides]|uniref:Proenkephalin-B n=1 Tax=Denticeps clupeoides TaxID=299321 RepID=A0AAY4ERZ3_9TELE|nr:proenkephalin-B [Denticeps clupeoides]XP_028850302.1 proenkephalin-B [Denticeps clupeoides]
MEWYVLVLLLSWPSLTEADCSSRCLKCALQVPDTNMPVNRLTCALECEGALPTSSETTECEKVFTAEDLGDAEDVSNLVKRYGGFIKRIDKKKVFAGPWLENANLKGLFAKKYGEPLGKFGERDVPEFSEDAERGDVASENETGVYGADGVVLNEAKRYGGFLRKFPKRSGSAEEGSRPELQKRYGGFMRRIRPKLKWDNQKRYGGFLRRHFKISVRSDEEPSSYDSAL